jgi:hypothetical protein
MYVSLYELCSSPLGRRWRMVEDRMVRGIVGIKR